MSVIEPMEQEESHSVQLILIRHAEAAHADGRCIGHTDLALSDRGRASLAHLIAPDGALADALQAPGGGLVDAVVVTSDLSRARDTAAAIVSEFTLPLVVDPRLREMHFGAWDGRNWHELEMTEGAALREWMAQWTLHAPPGGETVAALAARVDEALDAISLMPHDAVVVVSHAGWIRTALCKLRDIPLAKMFDIPVDHLSVTVVELQRPRGLSAMIG